MTDTTATTTPPETAEHGTEAHTGSQADAGAGADPGAGTAETGDDERDEETGRYLSREAARYRTRLREVERERDQLREQLCTLQRAEVERLASAAALQVAGDVWTFGAELEHLRAEDGSIDTEVVDGLVADLLRDRPQLRAQPRGDLGIGRGGTAAGRRPVEVGLSALLKPGRT
jgi:hypothetical protein